MNYDGRPLHDALWRRYNEGLAAAEALRGARAEYIAGLPHGETALARRLSDAVTIFPVRQTPLRVRSGA